MKKILIVVALVTTPALAQLASDEIPHQRTLPVSEQVRNDLETSRFRLGFLRIRPSLAVHDLGYDNNVLGTPTDPIGDWRSSVSAGAHFIVPLGRKIYARASAVPEYTWYRKLTERRILGGNYGGSLLGLFNHVTVEGGANAFSGLSILSSELERETVGRRTLAYANVEVDVVRRLSIFGNAREEHQRYDLSANGLPALNGLQRNDRAFSSGLRYRFRSYFAVSIAAEKTTSEFLSATDHNNSSNAVLAGVRYDRPRSFINLSVGSRTGEARLPGVPDFPRYTTTTGSYYAAHDLGRHALVDVYGHRGLVYSLYINNAYYLETRNGAGVVIPLGRRVAMRAFGEAGTNDYPRLVDGLKRSDDAAAWGGGVAVRFYRNLGITAIASKTRYASNFPGFDRSVLRIATAISLQRDLFR